MPIKPLTGPKLAARKRHWNGVRSIQDEFSAQYIHLGLKVGDVVKETYLSPSTVSRFFHRGKGNGTKGYSWLHGPRGTTIFAVAEALNLQITVQRRGETKRRVVDKRKYPRAFIDEARTNA